MVSTFSIPSQNGRLQRQTYSTPLYGSPSAKVGAPTVISGHFIWSLRKSTRSTADSFQILSVDSPEWVDAGFVYALHSTPSDFKGFVLRATIPGVIDDLVGARTHSCTQPDTWQPCITRISEGARRTWPIGPWPQLKTDEGNKRRYLTWALPPLVYRENGTSRIAFVRREYPNPDTDVTVISGEIPAMTYMEAITPSTATFSNLPETAEPAAFVMPDTAHPYALSLVRDPKDPEGKGVIRLSYSGEPNANMAFKELNCAEGGGNPIDGSWFDQPAVFLNDKRSDLVLRRLVPNAAGGPRADLQLRRLAVTSDACKAVGSMWSISMDELMRGDHWLATLETLVASQGIVEDMNQDGIPDMALIVKGIANPQSEKDKSLELRPYIWFGPGSFSSSLSKPKLASPPPR